jgi:hypothetical protein
MTIVLAKNVHFSILDDTAVFLHLRQDKYFALSRAASQALRAIIDGKVPTDTMLGLLAPAVRQGLLEIDPSARDLPAPCSAIPAGTAYVSAPHRRLSMRSAVALYYRFKASLSLRLFGPYRVTTRLAKRARTLGPLQGPCLGADFADICASHRWSDAWLGRKGHCLPRSIALFDNLISRGLRPTLIVGVRVTGFTAHCWIQHGKWILNDDVDTVRLFQPIFEV